MEVPPTLPMSTNGPPSMFWSTSYKATLLETSVDAVHVTRTGMVPPNVVGAAIDDIATPGMLGASLSATSRTTSVRHVPSPAATWWVAQALPVPTGSVAIPAKSPQRSLA